MRDMPPLKAVLAEHGVTEEHPAHAALVAREEQQAEALRHAGLQFGAHPEIVSEVLAVIGLGEITPEFRVFIHNQFVAHIERLIREATEGGETS